MRRLALGTLVFVLVAGLAAGGVFAFRFLRGAGDRIASLVPDDTAVYATAYLDPSGGQKLAALGLLGKFPNLGSQSRLDSAINDLLDRSLSPTGLNHNDVRPWAGSQLAVVVSSRTPASSTDGKSGPSVAFLVSSTDDSKAQAALTKFESGAYGRQSTWTTRTHGGTIVNMGTRHDTGELATWAVVAGAVVIGNRSDITDEIIDTGQGNHPALASTPDFTTVNGQLPSDRLGLAYVDVPKVVSLISGTLRSRGTSGPLAALGAYHGAELVVSAMSDGVALDGALDFDRSKLPSSARPPLDVPPHLNSTLSFVPRHAFGFEAFTGLPQLIRSVLDQLASSSAGADGAAGLAFIKPLLTHLTGDAAIEVEPGAGHTVPAGAFLFGVDSESAAQGLFTTLSQFGCGASGSCSPASTSTQSYRGTTITTLTISPDLSAHGLAPSWAASGGMAIVASTPDEVKAVLDAHAGSGVASSAGYQAMIQHVDSSNNALLYIDVSAVAAAIRSALPPEAAQQFDSKVAAYLGPFKALVLSSRNQPDRATVRAFVAIR